MLSPAMVSGVEMVINLILRYKNILALKEKVLKKCYLMM
jgi:hypothetical protein